MDKKRLWTIIGVIIIILLLVGINFFQQNSPRKVLKNYLKTVQEHKAAAAGKYLAEGATLAPAVEEWIDAVGFRFRIKKDESWREKEDKFKPFVKYLASNYKANVEVIVDEEARTYQFRLTRKGAKNAWSIFGNIYKDWQITEIKKIK